MSHSRKKPLALVGFMGSGKSVVGSLVAERTRAPLFDLDRMIQDEAGKSITEIFATGGEPAFRELEARLLPVALQPGAVVALGGGSLINDASWDLVAGRAVTIYLEVPFETIWTRISKLSGRPLASGRSHDDVESLFERRRPRYEQALHRVDGDRPPAEVADEVIKLWSA
ncbi:MAG TPA: shikimate kinase [Candidatus Eisenbacteria bacterium]|nr:shikimate kinase [Candidatus Eisenbacteria bacterium]